MSIIPPAPGCLAHSRQTVFPNLMDNSLCLVLQIIFHLHTHFKESPPVFRPPCWDIDSYLWGHTFGIFKLLHLLILEHSLSLLLSAPPPPSLCTVGVQTLCMFVSLPQLQSYCDFQLLVANLQKWGWVHVFTSCPAIAGCPSRRGTHADSARAPRWEIFSIENTASCSSFWSPCPSLHSSGLSRLA